MSTASIPLFREASFDPETTRVMGEAFERACNTLGNSGQPVIVREIIAKRILQVARDGERNPDELCERALKALSLPK